MVYFRKAVTLSFHGFHGGLPRALCVPWQRGRRDGKVGTGSGLSPDPDLLVTGSDVPGVGEDPEAPRHPHAYCTPGPGLCSRRDVLGP